MPYRTLSTKATNNEKKTGLGLVIAKKVIDAHGGDIFYEHAENRCKFYSKAPRVPL